MAQSDLTRIASNIAGLNALNALKDINTKLAVHQLRLSTGKRINEAADDPAGLTIGTKFNARARGLGVAIDNIGDAKNLLAVAEGGLSKINDIALIIRDKVAQAASDALGADERAAIGAQINSLLSEIDTITDQTTWNKRKLIAGEITDSNPLKFQTGAEAGEVTEFYLNSSHKASDLKINTTAGLISDDANFTSASFTPGTTTDLKITDVLAPGKYIISVTTNDGTTFQAKVYESDGVTLVSDVTANATSGTSIEIQGTDGKITVTLANAPAAGETLNTTVVMSECSEVGSADKARDYLKKVDNAIATISNSMTSIGALVSRLTSKEEALTIAKTNTEAAYNRIMNADMAAEQLEAMKLSILQQTATAMLAQANVAPQAVLSLFR
ncbi:MAG TPA: flagellin protein [Firmicutes bacterium]|nr:flagellin protein [Bacillota bacterium]